MVAGEMRIIKPALLLLTPVVCLVAQQIPPQTSQVQRFHWSEHRAHELRDRVNLANSKALTSSDRDSLIRLVEAEVRPLMEDNEIGSEKELHKLVLATRVQPVDLNGDGKPEFLLQAFDIKEGCGATGNCALWIFEKTQNGFKKILDTRDKDGIGGIELITVESGRTNGYADLTLAAHDSASAKDLLVYRFSRGRYRQTACYIANWVSDQDPTKRLPKPDIVSCPK